ncbi:MAG: DAK2 domain-containing protein [Lachnospiraceae bacterium]|nr:DAK2 domain-containing protein [Lachnospiraceae bacterium]
MDIISIEALPALFEAVAKMFSEKKDELCDMDAKMGDGDLGLTMDKGFGAMPDLVKENTEEGNIGKTLFKSGSRMAALVPSTMGTLMASGIMEGGKKLNGESDIDAGRLAVFWRGYADGIKKRGKCEPGDRTVLDAIDAAASAAEEKAAAGGSLSEVALAAKEGAAAGCEATKDMKPVYGKAAVHEAASAGVCDQGATVGKYLAEAFYNYISG